MRRPVVSLICPVRRQRRPSHRTQAGFTLIELLVVIGIIAILASLILAVTGKAKFSSQQTVGLSNMRQVGVGFQLYAGEHDFQLPGRVSGTADRWPRILHDYLTNTKVYLAPGIETDKPDDSTILSNDTNGTSFIMNGYNDLGAFDDPTIVIRTVNIPEPAKTILLGMPKAHDGNFYMDMLEGGGNHLNVLNLNAYGDGSNYVFADGSSRFIKQADYDHKLWLVDKAFPVPTPEPTP